MILISTQISGIFLHHEMMIYFDSISFEFTWFILYSVFYFKYELT
jgi:hypothetical protein